MRSETTLTKDNWRATALAAIEKLPDDIKVHVGYADSPGVLELRVAGNPIAGDDNDECSITSVTVRWWDKLSDDMEYAAQHMAMVEQLEAARVPNPVLRDQLNWPVVTIEGELVQNGLFPGRATTKQLEFQVQNAVLEALHSGGGWSVVLKDNRGRFVREDGSRIIDTRKR